MSDKGMALSREQVLSIVMRIPYGRVISYGTIAKMMEGTSARSVGAFIRQLPAGHTLPWHRIVRSDRTLACHGGNTRQRELLEQEDVGFDTRGRIDVRFFWP